MALSSIINRVENSGNDVTTVFSFPYYFLADGDLVVIITNTSTKVETVQTITTHYTVAGAGDSAGGTVTMITPPATGETLTIYRDPALTQGLDLAENDSLPAEESEKAYDRLTMIAQRLAELVERSPTLSDGFVDTFSLDFPSDLATADNVLGVNSAGNAWEMKTADDLMSLAGALLIANNLSDLGSVGTALVNLGISPLSVAKSLAFTDGMAATDVTGLTFDGTLANLVKLEYAINQGAGTKMLMGSIIFVYDGTNWNQDNGSYGGLSGPHDLTFSFTESGASNKDIQVRVATASGSGTGNVGFKSHTFLQA